MYPIRNANGFREIDAEGRWLPVMLYGIVGGHLDIGEHIDTALEGLFEKGGVVVVSGRLQDMGDEPETGLFDAHAFLAVVVVD